MSSFHDRLWEKLRCPDSGSARIAREFVAEVVGTFLLVGFGDGAVASAVLFKTVDSSTGDFFSINWGYSMGLMLGIMVAGSVSGAHLNPAVTTTMALLGKLVWWKMFHYMLAQYLGAFLGAALVYSVYYPKLSSYHGDKTSQVTSADRRAATAGIFATYPDGSGNIGSGFYVELILTSLLLFGVLAITDSKNMKVPSYLYPLYIALLLLGIGMCFGPVTGYAINPARDFMPRVFTAMAGWGGGVFSRQNGWTWVPIVAPHIGGAIGGLLYILLIGNHIPDEEDQRTVTIAGSRASPETPAQKVSSPAPPKSPTAASKPSLHPASQKPGGDQPVALPPKGVPATGMRVMHDKKGEDEGEDEKRKERLPSLPTTPKTSPETEKKKPPKPQKGVVLPELNTDMTISNEDVQ